MKTNIRLRTGLRLGAAFLPALLALSVAVIVNTAAPAAADEPPVLPASPPSLISLFNVEAPPAQYDLSISLLDFGTGAFTRERRFVGRAFFTVVEGQLIYREAGKPDAVYERSKTFSVGPETVAAIGNTGKTPARLFMTTLTSPGSPAMIDHPGAVEPAVTPKVSYTGQTTVRTQAGRFTLNQVILDFRPGAGSGAHKHSGVGLTLIIAGEMTNRLLSGEVKQAAGGFFVDAPDRPIDHRNFGYETATVAASYLTTVGSPPAVAAVIPGSPPLLSSQPAPAAGAAIVPPRTGDGGLVSQD